MLGSAEAGRLGARTRRLKIVDYYTVPWEDVPGATPPAVMLLVRDWYTEKETVFAWHLAAELQGIPAAEIPTRQAELERHILREFSRFVAANPKARWLHWGLDGIRYGFPALAHRMAALKLGRVKLPADREVDLAQHLKWQLGEDYVPHKRLTSLVRLHQINDHGWLDTPALTAAYRDGRYGEMLESLRRKVYCIARALELYFEGKLTTDPSRLAASTPWRSGGSPTPWFQCLRKAINQSRERPQAGGPLPDWVREHFRQFQYVLLRVLWGRGEVPIREAHQAVYNQPNGKEESLDKVKDRVNAKLSSISKPYEIITRRGEVFALVQIQ